MPRTSLLALSTATALGPLMHPSRRPGRLRPSLPLLGSSPAAGDFMHITQHSTPRPATRHKREEHGDY
ncbi:hypothetical protein VTO73DRAFT_2043 [Trametes versicolor]